MSVVFILVFVAIIMAGAFLVAFIWAVKSGQYEDTYTPSVRILFDDMEIKEKEKTKAPSPPDSYRDLPLIRQAHQPKKVREHETAYSDNPDINE